MPLMLFVVMETGIGYQGHIYNKHIHSFTEHEAVGHSQSRHVNFYSSLSCFQN